MSEPAHQTSDSVDLEKGVDSLVRESHEAAGADRRLGSDSNSDADASEQTPETPEGGETVADASMAPEELDEPAPQEPETDDPSAATDDAAAGASSLDDEAQSLVDDAVRAARPQAPESDLDQRGPSSADQSEPAASPAPDGDVEEVEIENLDDALAEQADRLAEDESDDEVEGSFEAPAAVEQAPREQAAASIDADEESPPADIEIDLDEVAPAPAEAGEAPQPTPTPQAPHIERAPEAAEETPSAGNSDEPADSRLVAAAAPLGRFADLLARPLDRVSPKTRDTIGWIAINTAFLAVCVWLYVILR